MNSNYLNADMIQILYLSVIFDFMAFTAQTFRRVLKRKPSTPANLKAIRDIMVENISQRRLTMTVTTSLSWQTSSRPSSLTASLYHLS
jgi:hypothetical protein